MKPLLYAVCPRPPHPARDGSAIRNFHLLGALAEDFRVRAFVLLPPHLRELPQELPPGVEGERFPQSPVPVRRAAALAASAVGRAYSPFLYRSRPLTTRLRQLASSEKPAWIVAHSYHVAPLALDAFGPLWIDFHNLDSELWRRMGESAPSRLARAFARSQAPRVSRVEASLVARSGGVSCVSQREAELLARLAPKVPRLVVPNGVDLERYAFRAEPAREEIVFYVGDLTWPPHAQGMAWFRREVWPLVERTRPQARAEIVGRGAAPGADGRFTFFGEGDDTRPHWSRAAVAVVPLKAAAGTRLKILEAAACGVPVVSTSVGAEGLDLADVSEIRIADGAAEFAAAVSALLADPDARRRQAEAARRKVEERYGWRSIGRSFAHELLRRFPGARA
ncbi:MAG TPA: glycosyltransferase [Thermoanaerobaculia bacterium]|nr:glycosyltransferase [Thermoanaerobaculia bacterium]